MKEPGKPYLLTNEQQEISNSQVNSDKSLYTEAEVLFTDLKKIMGYKLLHPQMPEKTCRMLYNIIQKRRQSSSFGSLKQLQVCL